MTNSRKLGIKLTKKSCLTCKLPILKRKIVSPKNVRKSTTKKGSMNAVGGLVVKEYKQMPSERQIDNISPEVIKNALMRLQTRRFGSTLSEIATEIKKQFPEMNGFQLAADIEGKMRCACEAGIAEKCSHKELYRLADCAAAGVSSSVDRTSLATEAAQFWECCNRADPMEACRNKRLEQRSTEFSPFASFDENNPFRRARPSQE